MDMRIWVLASALWLGFWSLAWGHDIYSHEPFDRRCCNDRDCRPLEPHEVVAVPGGFEVLGHFIKFEEAEQMQRRSPDGRFHACFVFSGYNEGEYTLSDRVRFIGSLPCLWAPEAGI